MKASTIEAHVVPEADVGRAIHVHCDRAARRLRVLARERNDVLLSQALRSVRRAAELSARMGSSEKGRV